MSASLPDTRQPSAPRKPARDARVLVVMPAHNEEESLGPTLARVHAALPKAEIVVVNDYSTDRTSDVARANGAHVVELPCNLGYGGAVQTGFKFAIAGGFDVVLQIDADGQHDPRDVPRFLKAGLASPGAIICGAPVYDQSAPKSRLYGRWLTTVWIWINTLSTEIQDGMCGYRLYPAAPLLALFDSEFLGSRMDFDVELLVRLKWRGLRIAALPVTVCYPADGTSNFRLFWDNVSISRMHTRLFFGMLLRSPLLLWAKWRNGTGSAS